MKLWIPPQSVDLQSRTKLYHTARGVSWYIKQGPRAKHPLAFSWAIGLQAVDWYSSPPTSLYRYLTQEILIAVAGHWRGRLEDLDLPMLALRFGCLPTAQHELAVQLMSDELLLPKEYRMKRVDTIPPDVLDRLDSHLASLEQALLEKDPMMPQHLRNTHSILISYPETVHLLEDAEIARIIDAAESHTKTEIIKATVKKATGTRKKVDVSDL
jgi:hypothetical protein